MDMGSLDCWDGDKRDGVDLVEISELFPKAGE